MGFATLTNAIKKNLKSKSNSHDLENISRLEILVKKNKLSDSVLKKILTTINLITFVFTRKHDPIFLSGWKVAHAHTHS